MRPEDDLLLLCVLAERNADQEARLRALAANPTIVWNDFWQHAVVQQVVPQVTGVLTDPVVAPFLPEYALHDARKARAQKAARNLALHGELQRVCATLEGHGVPVVALKGTALGLRLYGCLSDRQAEDIDILVPKGHLPRARSVLQTLGYRPITDYTPLSETHPFHETPLYRNAGTLQHVIELHWKLSDPRFSPIDDAKLWSRVLAQPVEPNAIRSLPAEELLLFLAIHLFKHDLVLRRVADIDRLVRLEGATIDWSFLLALAAEWSGTTALYFALELSHRILGTPMPPAVRSCPRPAFWRRFLVRRLSGWRAILGWIAPERRRYARWCVAHCATIYPWPKALAGYFLYLFPAPSPRRRGALGPIVDLGNRLGGGAAHIGLAMLEVVGDPRAPTNSTVSRPLLYFAGPFASHAVDRRARALPAGSDGGANNHARS